MKDSVYVFSLKLMSSELFDTAHYHMDDSGMHIVYSSDRTGLEASKQICMDEMVEHLIKTRGIIVDNSTVKTI